MWNVHFAIRVCGILRFGYIISRFCRWKKAVFGFGLLLLFFGVFRRFFVVMAASSVATFTIESCVRGYHVYKDLWSAEIGEKPSCWHFLWLAASPCLTRTRWGRGETYAYERNNLKTTSYRRSKQWPMNAQVVDSRINFRGFTANAKNANI